MLLNVQRPPNRYQLKTHMEARTQFYKNYQLQMLKQHDNFDSILLKVQKPPNTKVASEISYLHSLLFRLGSLKKCLFQPVKRL